MGDGETPEHDLPGAEEELVGERAIWSCARRSDDAGEEEEKSSEQPVWRGGVCGGGKTVEGAMESGTNPREVRKQDDEP